MSINTLYIVSGKPGVGKTTFGKQLSKEQNALFLDIDIVTEPVVKAGLFLAGHDVNDRDSAVFKKTFRSAIYESLFATAEQNLAVHSVVITGPFSQELQQSDWVEQLKMRFQCPVLLYYLSCTERCRLTRMKVRNNPRDNAKFNEWQQHKDDCSEDIPACPHIYIDTN